MRIVNFPKSPVRYGDLPCGQAFRIRIDEDGGLWIKGRNVDFNPYDGQSTEPESDGKLVTPVSAHIVVENDS